MVWLPCFMQSLWMQLAGRGGGGEEGQQERGKGNKQRYMVQVFRVARSPLLPCSPVRAAGGV